MLQRFKLGILLQGLALLLWGAVCEASSLGLTVHVEPLNDHRGEWVHAHFTAIVPAPCPSLTGLCAAGEDCLVHETSLPFSGTRPSPGWCVRRWQKTVPSNFKSTITLGFSTDIYVAIKAAPVIRENSGRLNQPPYVALLPPIRTRVNCPHHFYLSVKDLDGDKVRCRFARQDQGECVDCPQHSFIELSEEKCMLWFTGNAEPGQYFIYLMAEDLIPMPPSIQIVDNNPLSSVPVHLSLTVEASTTKCSDEPLVTEGTPKEDTVLFVLPYQEVKFDVNYESQKESIFEVAVVGPPGLFRVGFKSVGTLAVMTMAWVRSENKLPRLLPVCFAGNTRSLQSHPQCIWLYQREIRTLPDGTVLKCEKTTMTLVLPIASLRNIDLAELQLNSATCPVFYNSTHLTATISLNGCGTKTVHSGSELVYTNTLQSVHPYTVVRRRPSLILPLACRIPAVKAQGPQYQISIPSEKETFGAVKYWLEFHMPGHGPMAKFTGEAKLRILRLAPGRVRRDVEPLSERNALSSDDSASSTNYTITTSSQNSLFTNSNSASSSATNGTSNSTSNDPAIGSWIEKLDLHVMSNCSIDRAEMIVSNCLESETEDFAESNPILEQGCAASNSTLEVITTQSNSKIYRLVLRKTTTNGTTMYFQCTVNLCIATQPSQKCPDLCTRSFSPKTLIDSVFSNSYTIRSGPVSLVVTTPAPTTVKTPAATTLTKTTITTTTKAVTTTAAQSTTSSHAPEQTSAVAVGVVLTTISIFLQNAFLH